MTRLAIVLALLLPACAIPQVDTAVKQAVSVGVETADDALEASEFYLCRGARIGAIKRRYGTNAARADAYNELCSESGFEIKATPSG